MLVPDAQVLRGLRPGVPGSGQCTDLGRLGLKALADSVHFGTGRFGLGRFGLCGHNKYLVMGPNKRTWVEVALISPTHINIIKQVLDKIHPKHSYDPHKVNECTVPRDFGRGRLLAPGGAGHRHSRSQRD